MKAYYDQNRELILASKQARNQANPKAKRVISRKTNSRRKRNLRGRGVCMQCIPFGCNLSNFIHAQGTGILSAFVNVTILKL